MEITEQEKEILRSFGDKDSDFPQIEAVTKFTTYTLFYPESNKRGVRISEKRAIELLGRRKYLAGISRSAFHYSAVQEVDDEGQIFFDSSRYIK